MSDVFNFKTRNKTLFPASVGDLNKIAMKDKEKLLLEESTAESKGSGWELDCPLKLILRISQFNYKKRPSKGSVFFDLPKPLQTRRSLISTRNTDSKCFMYATLTKHLPGVTYMSHLTEQSFDHVRNPYNYDGIRYPTSISNIKTFERNNPNCTINVL